MEDTLIDTSSQGVNYNNILLQCTVSILQFHGNIIDRMEAAIKKIERI